MFIYLKSFVIIFYKFNFLNRSNINLIWSPFKFLLHNNLLIIARIWCVKIALSQGKLAGGGVSDELPTQPLKIIPLIVCSCLIFAYVFIVIETEVILIVATSILVLNILTLCVPNDKECEVSPRLIWIALTVIIVGIQTPNLSWTLFVILNSCWVLVFLLICYCSLFIWGRSDGFWTGFCLIFWSEG